MVNWKIWRKKTNKKELEPFQSIDLLREFEVVYLTLKNKEKMISVSVSEQ